MPVFTLEQATSAFTSPTNLAALAYMMILIFFWYSARYWQTPEKINARVKFFNPSLTKKLQDRFRSPFLDWFTSVFWFWIFGVSIFLMWFICMFQGPAAYLYGIPIITAVTTSMMIQIAYPVVVPIRYADFGKELPVTLIRMDTMGANTDKVNGLLYNGLPSNHLGMVITGLWLCVTIYGIDPWKGWLVIALAFIIFAIIFMFSVLYLGEHYWQDLIAAIVVYLVVLIVVYNIVKFFFPYP